VHHVQTESDLRSEWFLGADTVGITAGTSTPDEIIDRIDQRIQELAVEPSISSEAPGPAHTSR
jgi:4-hydroxy-3-methylbut-2-enyl diphosphate reductase